MADKALTVHLRNSSTLQYGSKQTELADKSPAISSGLARSAIRTNRSKKKPWLKERVSDCAVKLLRNQQVKPFVFVGYKP